MIFSLQLTCLSHQLPNLLDIYGCDVLLVHLPQAGLAVFLLFHKGICQVKSLSFRTSPDWISCGLVRMMMGYIWCRAAQA